MFVYTFENIQKIKDLKHSTEVKSKHAKKIKKINNSYFVNSGAPHYVEFVDDLNKIDIIQEVTKIKSSEFYENLPCNINFIQKENNLIYLRTFEKGVDG